jgi:2-hydroxychromene-2-carboxylate isomerase
MRTRLAMASSDFDGRGLPATSLRDSNVSLVVLDLASVETYLLVRLLSRTTSEMGGAIWCPLEGGPAELDIERAAAERRASELQLSVRWPSERWCPVPRAMRVAALAMEHRCAEPYMRGMSRMAFANGLDINKVTAPIQPNPGHLLDPEPLYAAVDAELALDEKQVMKATHEGSRYDRELRGIANQLFNLGIARTPSLRHEGALYVGADAISAVLLELHAPLPG